ncbi:MAG TPA: hypothetical protein VJW76_01655 [Verrucomicrobiae bacterium]|nr:hypothetical protein [Verrucomicrobiae bacterium]
MKSIISLVAGLLALSPFPVTAAQTAQATLFCFSLRFQQGSSTAGDFTLDLTTIDPPALPNGELAPAFGDPTHFSFFILEDQDLLISIFGVIDVDVPENTDANQNGFADFFETSQAVSGTTSGTFATEAQDSGTVVATWSREAGAKDGNCDLRLRSQMFGDLGTFRHTFELLEYKGTLTYTPGTNRVACLVDLKQTGAPDNVLVGPMTFTKSPPDRFNVLGLQSGVWTNALSEPLSYDQDIFERDVGLKTNYWGFVDFADGDPSTTVDDYFTWMLSIDDMNDGDGDGIPDFSDDPVTSIVKQPELGLSRGPTTFSLTVSGTTGRLHEIQEATSLSQTNWNTIQSVTLTNDPQVVSLPIPATGDRFWRVRVP